MKGTYGFARVAAASPRSRVADPIYNAISHIGKMREAAAQGVGVLVFPELGITDYFCRDLFLANTLQQGAMEGLALIVEASKTIYQGLLAVGIPLIIQGVRVNGMLFINRGIILGAQGKWHIPTNGEFEEWRWFTSAAGLAPCTINLLGQAVPFGPNIIYQDEDLPELVVGGDECEDIWTPIPPSIYAAHAGALVLVNLSASSAVVAKAATRRRLIRGHSGRTFSAVVYAALGPTSSTAAVVFDGHSIIAEDDSILQEAERLNRKGTLIVSDVDLEWLLTERTTTTSWAENKKYNPPLYPFITVKFKSGLTKAPTKLLRYVDARPAVPKEGPDRDERCEEVIGIQRAGLVGRLEYLWRKPCPICKGIAAGETFQVDASTNLECTCTIRTDGHVAAGISGGLDSTLLACVAALTLDDLGVSRSAFHAFVMPGFGSSSRTQENAVTLSNLLGFKVRVVDIREQCFIAMRSGGKTPYNISLETCTLEEFIDALDSFAAPYMDMVEGLPDSELLERYNGLKEEGATPFKLDLSVLSFEEFVAELATVRRQSLDFENEQARTRKKLTMQDGFDLGTGNATELFQGWCTKGADQTSMYNPNGSLLKTLIKFLVRWLAETKFDGDLRRVLLEIAGQTVSPELQPAAKSGAISQRTENTIGPIELIDFFIYNFIRKRFSPSKIAFLATQAEGWEKPEGYPPAEIFAWMERFLVRLFLSQYKREDIPNGAKVGTVSPDPRGDCRMPADASPTLWIREFVRWLRDAEGGGKFFAT